MATRSVAAPQKRAFPTWPIVIGILVLLAVVAAIMAPRVIARRLRPAVVFETAPVTTITAVSSVESVGSVAPQQSGSVYWRTTGTVATVSVAVGDQVTAGQVLMTLDPRSAPQNVIQAQADLLSAQEDLETLLAGPTEQQLADADLAVIQAQEAVTTAQRNLDRALKPQVAYYQEQVSDAQAALTAAQQNAAITDHETGLQAAADALAAATSKLEEVKALDAQYPGYGSQFNRLGNAQAAYDRAAQDYETALYQLEQAQTNNTEVIEDARQALATAQANLATAQAGPDQPAVARYQAELDVAKANLARAQSDLAELQAGPDPKDVAAARARVDATQATLDTLTLAASFDGEVLAVNYQPGDTASQSQAAVVIANRTRLHVDAAVDESDVTQIQVDDSVAVTFDSLPDLTLSGRVASINPVGETVQGLVKYTVRIDLAEIDPRVLLGMTANVAIVTAVQADALAVQIEAVQLDDAGEYVNRVTGPGTLERVPVVSGQTQDDLVVVTGALSPGDVVQIPAAQPQQLPGPFGGGRG